MKTVYILGASGVIGQHMRLCIPQGVRPVWFRRTSDRLHLGIELNDPNDGSLFSHILSENPRPYAIVNLAGMADVDEVGRHPGKYHHINSVMPGRLAEFCQRTNIHLVHVSSQAVFNGDNPPYHESSHTNSVNEYGLQKIEAEQRIKQVNSGWTIVRPSFVLGVSPLSHCRANPAELMPSQEKQVSDRWFTANMATSVAKKLWDIAIGDPQVKIIHVAGTSRTSRYDLATAMGVNPTPVSHDDFPGLSPRPRDTTFSNEPTTNVIPMMNDLAHMLKDKQSLGLLQRAREISLHTGINEIACREKLRKGFSELHNDVTDDFHSRNPQDHSELLDWYYKTWAYMYELSSYHLDERFNYSGMCRGIANTLAAKKDIKRILVLGDGIGDMTLDLRRSGFDAVYHDLKGSFTARFAQMRLWMYEGHECETLMSDGWNPPTSRAQWDAICAADFMEHLVNVEDWVRWIVSVLRPGGMFFAQNAFNCGSGPEGSIPMHLKLNDHFEKDWDPLLEKLGLRQISSNWYEKPVPNVNIPEPQASVSSV